LILKCDAGTITGMRKSGTAMCIASGAAFGAMAIFGKLAYGEGVTVGTLLAVRFALAAALFWVLLFMRARAAAAAPARRAVEGEARVGGAIRGSGDAATPAIRSVHGRDIGAGLALGACGYSIQAACYFAALERIDAALLSLLLYTFPAMVAAAAVALGRERLDGRRVSALCLALAGILLVVVDAGTGTLDTVGVALGVSAALVYTTYILASDGVVTRMQPLALSALVCTGAAVSLTVGSALLGQLHLGRVTSVGWAWLACIAVVSTVAAIALFFAGLRRVGPTSASILATVVTCSPSSSSARHLARCSCWAAPWS
jgi:drug/metabolite transporter (DMT)-like permease